MSKSTGDLIAQIDIEIEACERAIRKAHRRTISKSEGINQAEVCGL